MWRMIAAKMVEKRSEGGKMNLDGRMKGEMG